ATGKPETPPSSLAATPTTSTAPNGRKRKRKGADLAAAPIIEADSGTATATDLENTSAGFAPSAAPAAASESGRSRSGKVIVNRGEPQSPRELHPSKTATDEQLVAGG
ncbi:unnamed protein product, partial [Pylaiella littoralis]